MFSEQGLKDAEGGPGHSLFHCILFGDTWFIKKASMVETWIKNCGILRIFTFDKLITGKHTEIQ